MIITVMSIINLEGLGVLGGGREDGWGRRARKGQIYDGFEDVRE
ncbi:MAG: hypothetical protein V1660_01345 [archaeon]